MKMALFAGVAAAVLTATLPVFAAPAPDAAPAASAPHGLTFAEIKAQADALWDRMDANHDGKVDAADRDARLLERFAKWDTNHDGMISKDEFLAFVHAREAKWHADRSDRRDGPPGPPPPDGWRHGGPDGEGQRNHGEPGRRAGAFAAMAIIAPAFHAARKDGVITRAAFDAAVKARFDELDGNHDGTLTREELRAAWHGRGQRGWAHGPHHDDTNPPPAPSPSAPATQ